MLPIMKIKPTCSGKKDIYEHEKKKCEPLIPAKITTVTFRYMPKW